MIGNLVLFSQDTGGFIRSAGFQLDIDGYKTSDLSLLVPHMFNGFSILEWAFARSPDPIVYIIRDDGQCLTLTFNEEQEVVAWTTWDTDGSYESVAAIRPSISDENDAAYFVVSRLIGGNTLRFIERTDDREFTDVRDCFFVDSGLTFDIPLTITASTAANPVVITSTAHGLVDDDEVDISDIIWATTVDSLGNTVVPDQLNGKRFIVDDATSNTFSLNSIEDGTDIDGSAFDAYVSGGKVRKAVLTISGFHHLASTDVSVLSDGNVITNLTVGSDGVLTLPRRASRVHVGLPYVSYIETLDPEIKTRSIATIQGQNKKIPYVNIRFEKSRGLLIGPATDNLVEMKQREFEDIGDPTALLTGDKDITIPPDWGTGRLILRQVNPLPMTILAIVPEIQVGER